MNQNLIPQTADFPTLFRIAADGSHNLTMPFAREIFLLECHVAGTSFRPEIANIEPDLQPGAKLRLQREPQNEFDEFAIALYAFKNFHVGYVPKTKNEILARLLDAGKSLSAKLVAQERSGSWLKLNIEIFLND